jgi:hypothetical protein
MSEVYGAEHLLRLFGELVLAFAFGIGDVQFTVALPDLVANTHMDDTSVEHLKEISADLLRCASSTLH